MCIFSFRATISDVYFLQTVSSSTDSSVIARANRLPVTCLAVTGCSYSLVSTSAGSGQTSGSPVPSAADENRFKKVIFGFLR